MTNEHGSYARRIAMAALIATAMPVVVHAQANEAARARAGLDASAAARFDAAIARAEREDLPTESIVSKALEGIAKRVPPERIAFAVEQRLDLLVRARAALQPRRRDTGERDAQRDPQREREVRARTRAEVSAVADAMQRGVDDDAVRRLSADRRPDEPISTSVHVLADLVQRGVPSDVALDVLSAWRARGNSAADLADVPAGIDRLVRQGMRPAQAGASLAATLRGRGRLEVPGRGRSRGQPPPERRGPPRS